MGQRLTQIATRTGDDGSTGLGDGTLRKFLDDPTGAKTLTDKTYSKLAAGAARKTGRPVGVAVDRTGALLVADDSGKAIWRVAPKRP